MMDNNAEDPASTVFWDYYMQEILGAFSRSLCTELCSVDLRLSSSLCTTHAKKKQKKTLKLMEIANIITQYNNIRVITNSL